MRTKEESIKEAQIQLNRIYCWADAIRHTADFTFKHCHKTGNWDFVKNGVEDELELLYRQLDDVNKGLQKALGIYPNTDGITRE